MGAGDDESSAAAAPWEGDPDPSGLWGKKAKKGEKKFNYLMMQIWGCKFRGEIREDSPLWVPFSCSGPRGPSFQ